MNTRVAELEKQVKILMAETGVDMPSKKTTKTTNEPNKKKSPTGYLVFSNAVRAKVKQSLIDAGNENPKPREVITEIAKQWKALSDAERDTWISGFSG